jgi:hypothetical protein
VNGSRIAALGRLKLLHMILLILQGCNWRLVFASSRVPLETMHRGRRTQQLVLVSAQRPISGGVQTHAIASICPRIFQAGNTPAARERAHGSLLTREETCYGKHKQ